MRYSLTDKIILVLMAIIIAGLSVLAVIYGQVLWQRYVYPKSVETNTTAVSDEQTKEAIIEKKQRDSEREAIVESLHESESLLTAEQKTELLNRLR